MSDANKELVRRLRAAGDARDEAAIDEIVSDGFVAHVAGLPDADKPTWRQNVADFYDAFEGLAAPIEEIVSEGDLVVIRVTFTGKHTADFLGVPASGNDIAFSGYFTLKVTDGQIVEEWGLMDMFALMSQIGAIPAP